MIWNNLIRRIKTRIIKKEYSDKGRLANIDIDEVIEKELQYLDGTDRSKDKK